MGRVHHIDWSDSEQSQDITDYQEAIQRPYLSKPSVSGQLQPSRSPSARQWPSNDANKPKCPALPTVEGKPSCVFCMNCVACIVRMSGWVLCTMFFSSSILFVMPFMLIFCEWVGGVLLVMGCCVGCAWRCCYDVCGCVIMANNNKNKVRCLIIQSSWCRGSSSTDV